MRYCTNNSAVIRSDIEKDSGEIIGLNLGFDFCAEHEFGIKWAEQRLGRVGTPARKKSLFGKNLDFAGLNVRITTKHDMAIELVEFNNELWLRADSGWRSAEANLLEDLKAGAKKASRGLAELLNPYSIKGDIRAAWAGSDGFCVVGQTDDGKEAVRLVHQALLDNRCFINQASGFMGRGGLCLLDVRKIPAAYAEMMRLADVDWLDLEEATEKSGIRERLKAADCGYYALKPEWLDRETKVLQFWLNPTRQDFNNYGRFTVEELDQWTKGEGPIPKTAK